MGEVEWQVLIFELLVQRIHECQVRQRVHRQPVRRHVNEIRQHDLNRVKKIGSQSDNGELVFLEFRSVGQVIGQLPCFFPAGDNALECRGVAMQIREQPYRIGNGAVF
jgi:hypothetical protein